MPRLTRKEIAELKPRLAQWQAAAVMSRVVDDTMERIGSTNLFNQGGLAFLRDAWIAAEFGKLRKAECVRLVADTWPDFELAIAGSTERFEAVEADDPARRRGDEYRNSAGRAEHDPVEAWIERAEQMPAWLSSACRKKAAKRYGGPASLVIYLNPGEYGIRQKEIEASFASATAPVKDVFDAVWVLWKNQAYRVWQDGQRVVDEPRAARFIE